MKLPKVETLIVLVFLGCVILWAISKCTAKRSDLVRNARETAENEDDERPVRRDTVVVQQPVQQQPVQITTPQPVNTRSPAPTPLPQSTPAAGNNATPQPGAKPQRPELSNTATQAAPSSVKYSTLFVTIDGLKVRKEPGLKGESIAKLELYEPVTFLNKKTDWTQEISLGYEKVTDHWVKIRTKSGKEGWVFGAGVHYYKMKRKGVMEK